RCSRYPLLDHSRFQRRENTGPFGAPKAGCIDSQENVCRTIRALRLDALEERVLAAFDAIDFDSGRFGVAGIESFVGRVMACGVEVKHLLLGEQRTAR